ncbi:MAG: polysaccharide deacetylase family protein [Candidatus Gastranaerophilaceae bacterium]
MVEIKEIGNNNYYTGGLNVQNAAPLKQGKDTTSKPLPDFEIGKKFTTRVAEQDATRFEHNYVQFSNPPKCNLKALQLKNNPYKLEIILKYMDAVPQKWGENVPGVISKVEAKEKAIALTFDACSGKGGYDEKLINFLIKNKIPATLFLNSHWIDKNPEIAKKLAQNPLFEIENHGTGHKPLSVNGKSAHEIQGTQNVAEAYDEIENNAKKIEKLTGHRPKFFRPGTAFCDEVGVKIAEDLGQKIAGFSLLGDAGATYSKSQIEQKLSKAKSGDIAIFHMNKPQGDTAEALIEYLPELKKQGFKFVRLDQVQTQ